MITVQTQSHKSVYNCDSSLTFNLFYYYFNFRNSSKLRNF